MDFEPSDYRIPGGNAVTLSAALAKEIKDRFFRDRDNRFHIYLLAAGLRRAYLQTSEGGKDSYTPEFRGWYAENKLEKLFGQLGSSFSKYAAAELSRHRQLRPCSSDMRRQFEILTGVLVEVPFSGIDHHHNSRLQLSRQVLVSELFISSTNGRNVDAFDHVPPWVRLRQRGSNRKVESH